MSQTALPADQSKRNHWLTSFTVIVGVIAMLGGAAKIYHGYREITGSPDQAQVDKLVKEADNAVLESNKHIDVVRPLFQPLLTDVDNLGLDAVRKDKAQATRDIGEHFTAAAKQLRVAKQKLDQAIALAAYDETKTYLTAMAKSHDLLAQVYDKNQEICRLVLDESIASYDALVPKILEMAASRDELQKQADADAAEANAIVKKKS